MWVRHLGYKRYSIYKPLDSNSSFLSLTCNRKNFFTIELFVFCSRKIKGLPLITLLTQALFDSKTEKEYTPVFHSVSPLIRSFTDDW